MEVRHIQPEQTNHNLVRFALGDDNHGCKAGYLRAIKSDVLPLIFAAGQSLLALPGWNQPRVIFEAGSSVQRWHDAGYQDAYYKQAQRVRTLVIRAFGDVFKQCDVVATPTSPTPAFKIGAKREALEEYLADIYTIGANLAGLPGLSVPAGFTSNGLPLGLQFLGPQQADVRVVQIGHVFQTATGYNERAPKL